MIKNKYFKKGIRFKCQGSSNCCISRGSYGFVYITKKDLEKISNYFNINIDEFKKKYCKYDDGYLRFKEKNKNGNCQFLKDKKCSIYKVRPTQCRTWPFWNENMKAKDWNLNVVNFCPGIGKGSVITSSKIKKILKKDTENEKKLFLENNKINHH